ncbi:MAG: hypothetical protein H7Z40_10065 [Phycisphaerae bacterium]|nr:hypothetical protein [Gemmatimonadaceae bacterium]
MMARSRPRPPVLPEPTVLPPGQLELFPERPHIERLNPKQVAGQRTAVTDIVRVRIRSTEPIHLIFHDRHGWYCETHGTSCIAVTYAKAFVQSAS